MRKTAILLALACTFARADYGPGTIDSDLLRSGTPVVTNAWFAVSNETAGLVRSMAGDKITDGTNMIDAARNVYLVRDNCWIRTDGLVLVPSAESDDTWLSITNTIYGEVSLYNSGSMWEEFETAIPTFLYRDGATLTNEDGRVVYRAGEYNSIVGRLALTNDIPTVVSADLTPATNYANQVSALVAREATNYTDAVAAEFEDGQRIPLYANNSGHSDYATELYDETATATYNSTDLIRESTNAAIAVADAKISTNNEAFVSAVLAVPLTGADAGDLAEIAGYGEYGTVGAAILALITGLAALKRRMVTAETVIAQKADAADLPYRLVEPGAWEFSDGGSYEITGPSEDPAGWFYSISGPGSSYFSQYFNTNADALAALSLTFTDGGSTTFTATRPSLPGHLCDRAGNRVVVSGDTTLTLPAANPGYLRDFLVRLTVSATSAVTWAIAQGESWDAMGAPPASFAAGTYLYHITEVAPGVFHAEDMLALVGLEAALAAINGGVAS